MAARNFPESSAILNAGTWKLTEFDHCWISTRLSRSFESLENLFRQQYDNQKLFLNTKYSTAEVSMKIFDHDPVVVVVGDSISKQQSLTLSMSLHQLAIIEQFNRQYQQLSYEMIAEETQFQKENNLRIALLSLIYCGLIRPIIIIDHDKHQPTMQSLLFELNDEKRFRQLIETNQCSNRLIHYEFVDFIHLNHQPFDKEIAKIFPTIVDLLTDVEMSNSSRKHLPPTPSIRNIHQSQSAASQNNVSMNDIQTRLLQLIDKRYIRRNNDGGFEYNIE
ncbi:hypothetical protein BLA29_000695 [Euroglyphus maynei]|uniref:Cullin family profile domain-containing protein n=1 Tax=Euroglyphus maynei TaxID=6958 RepID=A0A1Y3BII8_EURMA|nr:hypothetical protein BLA29_000695 [Euroglyphus maynei]